MLPSQLEAEGPEVVDTLVRLITQQKASPDPVGDDGVTDEQRKYLLGE